MEITARIRNATIVTPIGTLAADLLIAGEQIAGIVERTNPTRAAEEIDARGRWVLPGGVDLHAHTREPGYTHKEDFLSASQAAAAGGITSIVDMPNVEPPTDGLDLFEEKRRLAAGKSIVDWGHFVAGTRLDQIPLMAEAGATGYKIYQVSGAYPHDPRLAINDHDQLYRAFRAISATGLPCVVHPFDQQLFDLFSEEQFAAGEPHDHVTFARVYTRDVVWRSAISTLLEIQKETGVRLHVVHTHSGGALKLLKAAKAQGQRVTAAVDPKYYHLDRADLDEQGPRICPGGFIPEDAARMQTIWDSFADGTLDVIDSDHAPHTLEELERQRQDAWSAAMGSPQYDNLLAVVLTDVHDGKLSLETAVRLLSENPARIIGHFPRKGAILPGSDADVVIVDLEQEWVARDEDCYTKVRWTPYHGRRLKGKPVLTMLRGRVIMRDGKVVGQPGSGRYLAGVAQEPVAPAGYRSPGLAFQPTQASRVPALV